MLDREILTTNYGISYGSATLSAMQNDNVPELDLLVREAVQNSSDASLRQNDPFFIVNFNTGLFCPASFNQFLTGIEDHLNNRFQQETAHFMEIRDVKTSGLTGSVRKSEISKDDHGNFFKLIYDTGKKQTQKNAGGNWGYGKSVYYRVGIGIVVFYSHIKTDAGYESRLIVTLIEDESKKNPDNSDGTILGSIEPNSEGKAWWGIRDGEDLLPITDEELIESILNIFDLKPFKPTETGTSVIIPYINPEELLKNIIPEEASVKDDDRLFFEQIYTTHISDYLKLAIQKWYAPKIHNQELTKIGNHKWLLATVNNESIRKSKMIPIFRLVQELYTTSLAKTYSIDYSGIYGKKIECMPVNIQKYFESGQTSGYVSAIKISKEDLNQGQNLLNPYLYIGKYAADGKLNDPVVMFARGLGMVIDYSVSGPWVKNLSPSQDENEYIFAFYVPIGEKKLKADISVPDYAGMTLGEYLRKCEASDHMEWNDPAKMQIVTRIQRNTISQIDKRIIKGDTPKAEATASKLAAKLGRTLLPRIGYGKKKGNGNGGGGSGGGSKLKDFDFEVLSNVIHGNDLEISFRLKFSHSKKNAHIELIVASEGGWITPAIWQNDIGTYFPATIEAFTVQTISSNIMEEPDTINDGCSISRPSFDTDKMSVSLWQADNSKEYSAIKVESRILNAEIVGAFKIKAYDKKYRFSIRVE